MFTDGSARLHVKYKQVLLSIKSAACLTCSPSVQFHPLWIEYVKYKDILDSIQSGSQWLQQQNDTEFLQWTGNQTTWTDQQVQGHRSIIMYDRQALIIVNNVNSRYEGGECDLEKRELERGTSVHITVKDMVLLQWLEWEDNLTHSERVKH